MDYKHYEAAPEERDFLCVKLVRGGVCICTAAPDEYRHLIDSVVIGGAAEIIFPRQEAAITKSLLGFRCRPLRPGEKIVFEGRV
jgi:hypothetical protein